MWIITPFMKRLGLVVGVLCDKNCQSPEEASILDLKYFLKLWCLPSFKVSEEDVAMSLKGCLRIWKRRDLALFRANNNSF